VFETQQIHRRAFQFQLQGLTVQRRIQSADAVLVGAEAAVLMLMLMDFGGMGDSQRQQGERQGK
jgi:hypothetical protein